MHFRFYDNCIWKQTNARVFSYILDQSCQDFSPFGREDDLRYEGIAFNKDISMT